MFVDSESACYSTKYYQDSPNFSRVTETQMFYFNKP